MNSTLSAHNLTAKQSARLGAYLATSVGASMIAAEKCEAAIVYFEIAPANQVVPVGSNNGIAFGEIDLNTGTYVLGSYTDRVLILENLSNEIPSRFQVGMNGGWLAAGPGYPASLFRLDYGDPINASLFGPTTPTYAVSIPNWPNPSSAYVGMRWIVDYDLGEFQFGWAHLVWQDGALSITGFAIESEINELILAGDQGGEPIPEPGTWAAAALLAGGATYLRWRKRRNEAQKEAA